MHLESHLAIGWLMGNLVPRADRRFRALVTFSAMAPDLDGVSYLLGPDAYSRAHHVYGHNIFAGIACTILCAALASPGWRIRTTLFAALAFASHWVGDYYFSGWPLMTFWPFSRHDVMYRPRIGLDHPINMVFGYVSLAFLFLSPFVWKRTVFETFWPAMDRLLSGYTQPRTLSCALCHRPTAQQCARCGKPICLRHGKISRQLTITCGCGA